MNSSQKYCSDQQYVEIVLEINAKNLCKLEKLNGKIVNDKGFIFKDLNIF